MVLSPFYAVELPSRGALTWENAQSHKSQKNRFSQKLSHAIQTALGGHQSIESLVQPGGQLSNQREHAHSLLNEIPGVSCVKPKGALYLFPKLDANRFNITNDEKFVMDLLRTEKILVVQGSGFNWSEPDHVRLVFLPNVDELTKGIGRIERFLTTYQQT